MALLWIILGITFGIAGIISYYWIKFGASKRVLFTGLSGIAFFIFAVSWSVFSMYKGEPLTAALGLLSFGMPGILFMAAGWKLMATNSQVE